MCEGLYLGNISETGEKLLLDPSHLRTHAVCLGMTGSGKTGLGVVALEELAARSIPLLIIDLKGDMVDLLLNFPDFRAEDFAPWLSPDSGVNRMEMARGEADRWRKGLERSGIGPGTMRAVRENIEWRLLTPGYSSGAPLNILPGLSAPAGWDPEQDPDGARFRVDAVTGALLSLIDRGGDPLSDPDHVLIASIILDDWKHARPVDLAGLLSEIIDPPIETLGALPLEVFYPRERRMKLVLALNALLASPAFAAWTRGTPLDMKTLLGTGGKPRATIFSLAHLDEKQRLFCITLIASELVAWMRRRPASAGLSAMMYIDEVQGILPPHPANPPCKTPLMTLLKQGRAFGVGLWLSTQNPIDLDYKALGNAGIKLIGRLITERDRERAMEGLGLSGTEEAREIERRITGLDKRQFVLHDVRVRERIRSFSSRWAISYLRGPVTIAEMQPLIGSSSAARHEKVKTAYREHSYDEPSGVSRPPLLEYDISAVFDPSGGRLLPYLLISDSIAILRKTRGLDRELREFWLFPVGPEGDILWSEAEKLDRMPETVDRPPENAEFPSTAPPKLAASLKTAEKAFLRWRARQPLSFLANPGLKLIAEEGQDRESFIETCREAADKADDVRQERVRKRFERRIQRARKRLERERDELERDRAQLQSRKAEEKLGVVEGLFSVLLGSRSLRSAAGKAGSRLRSASSKHRMRRRAEGAVIESEHEIERIEQELEELSLDMQEEIESIAEASDLLAEKVEEIHVRARQTEISVSVPVLYWRS